MRGRLQPLMAGGKTKVFRCIIGSRVATCHALHMGWRLARIPGAICLFIFSPCSRSVNIAKK